MGNESDQSGRKTALLMAYNKEGLADFARELRQRGWDLFGSAGTAAHLAKHNIVARDIAEIVGPPILGHRVVSLSREFHAALLATNSVEDQAELVKIGVPRIDLVYVDLYPLEAEVLRAEATPASVIEKTDIGGPTALRSGAKGRRIVLCSQRHFGFVLKYLDGGFSHIPNTDHVIRSGLVATVEGYLSLYSKVSSLYWETQAGDEFAREWKLMVPEEPAQSATQAAS
jgi:AICAR transformylase/IMP cyclohydrolase PurH